MSKNNHIEKCKSFKEHVDRTAGRMAKNLFPNLQFDTTHGFHLWTTPTPLYIYSLKEHYKHTQLYQPENGNHSERKKNNAKYVAIYYNLAPVYQLEKALQIPHQDLDKPAINNIR